jgi:hypothetical protein
MAVLPMKQTVTIIRSGDGTADWLDEWGNPKESESFELKCRIEEGSILTRQMSGTGSGTSSVETIVANARLLFDKLADIKQTDKIVFTNELGIMIERTPKEINVKRALSGKPVLTEVIV